MHPTLKFICVILLFGLFVYGAWSRFDSADPVIAVQLGQPICNMPMSQGGACSGEVGTLLAKLIGRSWQEALFAQIQEDNKECANESEGLQGRDREGKPRVNCKCNKCYTKEDPHCSVHCKPYNCKCKVPDPCD